MDPVRDGDSRYCFGVTARGVPMDYRARGGAVDTAWNPGWERAVTRDEAGWTLEAGIPFARLEMEPEAGVVLGLNAYRRSTLGRGEMTCWSMPAQGRISSPAGYGAAVLK